MNLCIERVYEPASPEDGCRLDALAHGAVTLVYSAHDETRNQAVALHGHLMKTKSASHKTLRPKPTP